MLKELRRYRMSNTSSTFLTPTVSPEPPFKHKPLVDENGKTFPAVPIKARRERPGLIDKSVRD
jgi:hypothetical protein